jgi:hypothetical protein
MQAKIVEITRTRLTGDVRDFGRSLSPEDSAKATLTWLIRLHSGHGWEQVNGACL